ncbi:MAG: class III extradiol dioxygenase subunit B-like domain-containing protein [Patescibacteria group bacterium]
MGKIVFACISPHPPLILPDVGSKEDRMQVKKTINNLEILGRRLKNAEPDFIVISSPHQDWGFNVPLHFLARDFKGDVKDYLMGMENPKFYYKEGRRIYESEISNLKYKIALIASGDLSHCLKEEGPYGFETDGPKFDKDLVRFLKEKDLKRIFKLDEIYPKAGECGLRSFCFILGILDAAKINWKVEILSYEGPFGVGYLVANFKIN